MADAPAIQRNFADYEIIRHLAPIMPCPHPADGARAFVDPALTQHEVWELRREGWRSAENGPPRCARDDV